MLTPGAPGGGTHCDIEVRYALGRGESGIYAYAIFSHPASYGAMGVGESRYITKLNQAFDWISVDADRNMLECTPQDWGTGVVVHAKEQRILSTGLSTRIPSSTNTATTPCNTRFPPTAGRAPRTTSASGSSTRPSNTSAAARPSRNWSAISTPTTTPTRSSSITGAARTTAAARAATSPPAKTGARSSARSLSIATRWPTPRPPPRPISTRWPPPPATPPCRPPGRTTPPPCGRTRSSQAKKEKAQWPYDWVNGVDYPHKEERGNVTGQLVLNDPQAATTKLPHLTVGLAHPDYTGGGAGRDSCAVAATATGRPGPHDAKLLPVLERRQRGRQIHDHQRPSRHLHAARLCRRRAGRIRADQHHRRGGQDPGFGQTRLEARALRQASLGDRLPRPHRRQILQGRRRRTTGSGAGACATAICSRTTSPTPSARAITTRTGSSSRCRTSCPMPGRIPAAKDPLNQRFGWVKAATARRGSCGATIGRGRATTWTIKFNMDKASQGPGGPARGAGRRRRQRRACRGGQRPERRHASTRRPPTPSATTPTRASGRNTTLTFDAALLKPGENEMQLTVPAGELTTGVVYDYLRLEDRTRTQGNSQNRP